MKTINNLNTLNALIRDEKMAAKEYADLARDKKIPKSMQLVLQKMSLDEHKHMMNLNKYRNFLIDKRKYGK